MAGGAGRRGREGQVQVPLLASGDCSRRSPEGKGAGRSARLEDMTVSWLKWSIDVYESRTK